MQDDRTTRVPKVHPASRELLPEDPMELSAVELPGDSDLMLRLIAEEYARFGWGVEELLELARNPFYHALHALFRRHGEDSLRRQITAVLAASGVTRVRAFERELEPETLVHLEPPERKR